MGKIWRLAVFVLVIVTALAGCSRMVDPETIREFVDDGVMAKVTFQGENRWEYVVTGDLPTPCYSMQIETNVQESYPETVQIYATILSPEQDAICAQVVTPVKQEGSFAASPEAQISFEVERGS